MQDKNASKLKSNLPTGPSYSAKTNCKIKSIVLNFFRLHYQFEITLGIYIMYK